MTMTHPQREKRRRKIAEYAKTHTYNEAIRKFRVSKQTVYDSCRQHGVVKPDGRANAPSTYKVVAALIRGEKQVEVARRLGISRQFVNQCRKKMIEHGVFDAVAWIANKELNEYLAQTMLED